MRWLSSLPLCGTGRSKNRGLPRDARRGSRTYPRGHADEVIALTISDRSSEEKPGLPAHREGARETRVVSVSMEDGADGKRKLYLDYANVAKLADAQDLGSCPARGAGSTPAVRILRLDHYCANRSSRGPLDGSRGPFCLFTSFMNDDQSAGGASVRSTHCSHPVQAASDVGDPGVRGCYPRPLRGRARARPRRHGHGPSRPRSPARPAGRPEGPSSRAGARARPRAVHPGDQARRTSRPPAYPPRVRFR